MRNIVEVLFNASREVSEEERQASEVISDLCQKHELVLPEQLMAMNYFSGIDFNLIVSKVSTLNTPLIPEAMFYTH
ncbi:hypothetical protein GAP32_034 [Cronobacter phage vB_CsaM_GAP32]|uniref:Uncharacterized protein n=1 Tax=Cronobacter phage vB_CsaM_GAP32 TaxID=1141136 RepID=K4F751_9CAUD|nr:hypothetical protein GAP32_034 [Cronobacter phage vB_CsaM_GAP32]AFC21482.1 hypothetical protein GAP32_034 [Cronobacter phage vB_CsaM_GAP32]